MDSINEFYEGNLRSGLSAEQQTRTKNGIAIVKKDDYGSAFDGVQKLFNQIKAHLLDRFRFQQEKAVLL